MVNHKKILYLITKSNWGGAQRYVYNLAVAAKDNFEVAVAFGGTGGKDATEGLLAKKLRDYPETEIKKIFIRSLMRNVSLLQEFKSFFELIKLFRKERPDIVHLNSSKAGGTGALSARISGVPKIIFTSHGLAYDEDRNIFARFIIFIATWLTFLLCHEVIVISKNNFKRAKNLPFCSKKINLIHNGFVPITNFETRESARAKLGLPLEGLVVGTTAELTKNKGLKYLVQSAGLLQKKGVDFILCIIGSGEELHSLKILTENEGVSKRVHFTGFVPNAHTYLKAFDKFAFPSLKEGLPYALMEASFAGLPIVASNIGGNEDIVENEKTGFLIEPRNPEELARVIEKLITNENLRKSFGEKAKQKILRDFSASKMLEKTFAVYL